MGPVESNPDRYAGAWRLLIWAPLLVLGAALRANGLRVVVKTTGKMPVLIDAAGKETVLERPATPTANLREQKEIVRLAKEQHAQAIVIECMAVDPELRRVSQETLIRAALAVGVCEFLGLDRARALEGLLHSTPDYGTVRLFERQNHAGMYTFVCALGVNDVDSLLELQRELIRRKKLDGGPLVGLFNSRDDRAPRSVEFARAMARDLEFRSVIVTGRHTKAFVREAVRSGYPRDQLSEMEDATPREILEAVDARPPPGGAGMASGNMVPSVGYGLVEELVRGGSDGHTGS